MHTGIFPGSFDPLTLGHLDIVERAQKVVDRVIIAVARAYHKDTLFSPEERQELIQRSIPAGSDVLVVTFDGLLVDVARAHGASAILRGLRFVSDFEYEFQLALMNRRLDPGLETLFLMSSARYSYLNSSVIKEVARLGGDVSGLVPEPVLAALREKLRP